MPALDKQYFTVDMWLPEGTTIGETDRIAGRLIADPVRASVHAERLRQGGEPMDMASDLVSN